MKKSYQEEFFLGFYLVILLLPIISANMGYYDLSRIIVYLFSTYLVYKKITEKQILNASMLGLFIFFIYNPIFPLFYWDRVIWTLTCVLCSITIVVVESRKK